MTSMVHDRNTYVLSPKVSLIRIVLLNMNGLKLTFFWFLLCYISLEGVLDIDSC